MSFLTLAKKRYSVRSFAPKPVEEDKLLSILEAGNVAPTAANKQPYRLLVVQSDGGLKKLSMATNSFEAPLAIIVCGQHDESWIRPQDKKRMIDIDTSIVTDHMMLCATDLGLGTCWLTYFDPQLVRTSFNIPDHIEAVNILLIGYAQGDIKLANRHATERKPLTSIVEYETF